MRVISQNGEIDFPYERIAVYCHDNQVVCRMFADQKNCNVLGAYSTEEKAQKAMEMLRDTYERVWDIECGNRDATKRDTCSFVFPQDSEVEV